MLRAGTAPIAALIAGLAVAPVYAQTQMPEAPSNAAVQVGPLALVPVVRVNDIGYDTNVYNVEKVAGPKGDVTTTFVPIVEGWLTWPRMRVNTRSEFDFYYYRDTSDLRDVDSDNSGRVEFPLNRLTPYLTGNITDTRHRTNLEYDTLARRTNSGVSVGVDIRLSPKIVAGVVARRAQLEYQENAVLGVVDLSRQLDHSSDSEGASLRWILTPYTTAGVSIDRQRDRFDQAVLRNSDSFMVGPFVEFNPRAVISGRAFIGYQSSKYVNGINPDFSGTTALIDLSYTFRARTKFLFQGRRELQYSYLPGQRQYVGTELTGTVTQRLGDSWDVSGFAGRGILNYRPTTLLDQLPKETVPNYGGDLGYNMRRTRIGFRVDYRKRIVDDPLRINPTYDRLRIGSTVAFTF